MKLWLAQMIVDRGFYLDRNPDVAAAGVDPAVHFAECWSKPPLRAPNATIEPWIYTLSPLIVLGLALLKRDRPDITDCFRYRINQLSTRIGLNSQHKIALAIARAIASRPNLHCPSLGNIFPVTRLWSDERPWLKCTTVQGLGKYTFSDPSVALSTDASVDRTVARPSLWSAEIRDASIFGFSQIVAHFSFVAYEPAADPDLQYTSRQCEFIVPCFRSPADRVLARVPPSPNATLPEGILLVGRCGSNYFHFMIEYLTKGYVLECAKIAKSIPLIITEDLYPQEFEALKIVFPERDLIVRRHASRLDVAKLHVPSVMTYIPDTPTIDFWKVAAVNHDSLYWLRTRVLSALENADAKPSRYIYLGRTAGRNIKNRGEVEAVFRRNNFEIIDPAGLSFLEQVRIFSSAICIAGPIGAAFANVIFAPKGALVLGLVSPYAVQFPIFSSLAKFAECRYLAVPGKRRDPRSDPAQKRESLEVTHGDYELNIEYLSDVIRVETANLTPSDIAP
ncbi:glycosyltransferase family 61 protein [Methylobacterium sp. J-088]|uniref:glycosyltransferase family 61 protein n=1 Tax=Methylobacterium sp. J-088 TaxID=2836664 RepID=UPI001FBA3531|nr:glycosyltransferase family 61 protein [Methylobacterium sp. J-088]MCJ2064308.1 glycosyltransferase family 61 protein [Methylobacterium sp. J-088]